MNENIQPVEVNKTVVHNTQSTPRWDCTADEKTLREYYQKYNEHLAIKKRTPKPTLKKIDAQQTATSTILKIENRKKQVLGYIKQNDGSCCFAFDNNYRCDKPLKLGSCFCPNHHNAPCHFKDIRDEYIQKVNRNVVMPLPVVATPVADEAITESVATPVVDEEMTIPEEDPDEKEVVINDIILHCKKMAMQMQTSRKEAVLSMKECTSELKLLRDEAKKLEGVLGGVYEKIGLLEEKIKKVDEKTETNSNQRADQISQLKRLVDQISQ